MTTKLALKKFSNWPEKRNIDINLPTAPTRNLRKPFTASTLNRRQIRRVRLSAPALSLG